MEDRHERIVGASIAGIAINVVFVVLKTLIGMTSGSVSVLIDAVNNLTDVLSAAVTLVGVKLARKKPDREHPHGHGRMEYVAAVGVGLVIFVAGVGAVITSVPKIVKPELANYSILSLVVIFTTVIVKLGFGRHLKKVGKITKSRSLSGTGTDAMFDAVLSFGTLASAGVGMAFGVSIDGIVGAVIAAFIIKSAVEILVEGFRDIIGRRVDESLARKVRETIRSVEGVEGIERLILHDYGPEDVSGAVKIKVNENIRVMSFEKICDEVEEKVLSETGVRLIVGV